MPGVNEAIAREYFEIHGFLIRQPVKYLVTARAKRPDEEIDFLAIHPDPDPGGAPPSGAQVLASADMRAIRRAVVSVRGWHSERVHPSRLAVAPELVRFAKEPALRRACEWLGDGPITRILCIPGLPATPALQRKTIDALAEHGVDGILLFPTMLRDLIRWIDRHKNYEKSDLLQTLRILKNYGLFRDDQLELFVARRRRPRENHKENPS